MALQNKPVKVPVILQMEALECGAASLAMVLAYYKKWVPLEEVRLACGVSRDGSNALNVAKAAKRYGLNYKSLFISAKNIRKKATYPAIIFWNNCYFVVLDGFKKNYAYLNDPAVGRVRLPMEEFKRAYSNVCIIFEKGENFVPGGKPASALDFLKQSLKGNSSAVALVMTTGTMAVIAGTMIPVISRVFTDYLLSGKNPSWIHGLLLLFLSVILFELTAGILHLLYTRKATGKFAVTSNASFMHHLFRLPMSFFSQRLAGDLAQRAASNDRVASVMVGRLTPVVVNLMLLIFYLVVTVNLSLPLTAVGVLAILVNLILARIISDKRTEMSMTQMRDQSILSAASVSGINMVETIKASGAENGFLERWSGYHAAVVKAKVRFAQVNRFLGTLPGLLQSLSNVTIMIIAYYMIMEGHFTIGMFLAFQGCMAAFVSPVNELIAAGQTIQEMKADIERIHDVMIYPEDSIAKESFDPEELKDAAKLTGKIEMKHVTFGYSRLADPIIKDFNMEVIPGKRIAFVGSSGCGKSSLAKLLTGLYKPWEGEILFDGKPISEIPKPIFNGSLAMVDQDITMFQDTIANNIRMWDKTLEDFDVILAARDASIHQEIILKKGGYEHMLEENGRNLSGGQRQRLEIARVLAGDPSIIIMDEATSALDARTEYEISEYLHERGITCIIIALIPGTFSGYYFTDRETGEKVRVTKKTRICLKRTPTVFTSPFPTSLLPARLLLNSSCGRSPRKI